MGWHQAQGVFRGSGIPGAHEKGNNCRVGMEWEEPWGVGVVVGEPGFSS